jgi:hypothetical protein
MKKKLSIATILSISIIVCAMVAAGNLSSTGVQGALIPVFGNTVIGSILDQNDANAQSISYFTTTSTGLVTDIMAYIDGASSGNAIAAIYSVSGNTAGALLAQSKPVSLGTTFSWVDFPLVTPYVAASGTTYGLAIMGNVPVNVMVVSGTGQRDHNAVSSYATGFANPFGNIWGTDDRGAMSIYAVSSNNQIINIGTGSMVYLNLPPAPNATSPPAAPGTPSRPSDIQLRSYHYNAESSLGAFDLINVYLWIPQRNSYQPVATITNLANTEIFQNVWNNTFIWLKTVNPSANLLNVIQVGTKDLIVGTQSGSPSSMYGDNLWVNLTKSVTINLAFNLLSQPTAAIGNLTFTLPPMTLRFIPIANSYTDQGTNALLPSGYQRQPFATMRTPAWVEESIPSWLGGTAPLEVSGHIDYQFKEIITPPAT